MPDSLKDSHGGEGHETDEQCLILLKIAMVEKVMKLMYSLVVDTNFNWRVTAGKGEWQSDAAPFSTLSQQLFSVADVVDVVLFLDSYHVPSA